MRIFTGRRLNIEQLVFSPDGQHIACNGPTPSPQKWLATVWEVNGNGKPKHTFGESVGCCSFTSDNRRVLLSTMERLVTAGMDMSRPLWVTASLDTGVAVTNKALTKMRPDEVSRDGRWALVSNVDVDREVISLSLSEQENERWRTRWERELRYNDRVSENDPVEGFASLRMTTNGTRLLLSFRAFGDDGDHDILRVLDTASGEDVGESQWGVPASCNRTPAEHGNHLVFLSGRVFCMHDISQPHTPAITRTSGGKQHFTAAAFSPDGRLLATTSNDTTVTMWDTATWEPIRQYGWEIGRLRAVAFAPDGLTCAAGSDTGKVVLFDVDV